MITAWTQDCTSIEEKEQLQKSIYGSRDVLDQLGKIIRRELASLEVSEISPQFYETPNWDYKQAHTNGFKSAIRMVLKVINLDDPNKEPILNEQSI